jgi:hypothetical protein
MAGGKLNPDALWEMNFRGFCKKLRKSGANVNVFIVAGEQLAIIPCVEKKGEPANG